MVKQGLSFFTQFLYKSKKYFILIDLLTFIPIFLSI